MQTSYIARDSKTTIQRIEGLIVNYCVCFLASHEGSQRREEISLYTLWLQMQVGNAAEVPHDQAHRYHRHFKLGSVMTSGYIRSLTVIFFCILILQERNHMSVTSVIIAPTELMHCEPTETHSTPKRALTCVRNVAKPSRLVLYWRHTSTSTATSAPMCADCATKRSAGQQASDIISFHTPSNNLSVVATAPTGPNRSSRWSNI